MAINVMAQLVVDLRKSTTKFFGLGHSKDVVIVCAILTLENTRTDPTVSSIADMAGYTRRDTLNRLNNLVASGHIVRITGAGRAPDYFYLDNGKLQEWLASEDGQTIVDAMKSSVADAVKGMIFR